ncbi:hypothetical protein BRYFOR_09546 [Marvinbryantia formatexigens DSM 14469]|uniref:Uncharacterized protein n=1 Tax=Marvinbryantia formatexigens DSM 14469 TaxID=478749 RepID=C6LLJ8_9FIRM|nr:hypothetical protein BRYFOR_09546 [Marvinbryantia formatexigens DSM 14469]
MLFRLHYITENSKNPLSESVVRVFFWHFLKIFIVVHNFILFISLEFVNF